MPQILLKDRDVEEVITVDQKTFNQIEQLFHSAENNESEWEDIEDELDELLGRGKVYQMDGVINFSKSTPNFEN